jgi:capsular polysaccharide transport system permease protein
MEDDPQIVAKPIGGDERRVSLSEARYVITRTADAVVRRVFSGLPLRKATAGDLEIEAEIEIPPRAPWSRPSAYLISFVAFVVIPALVCAFYLIFIASDQYVSEARFAVQSAQFGLGGGDKGSLGALSAGGIPALAGQDAYIITNYIHSRAILQDLAGKVDVEKIYQRPEADFWSRLKAHPSAEELTDYWNSMVSTYIDGPSGIVTLQVKAFRPQDAQKISQAILQASEKLANDESERARQTIMAEAEGEVRRSQGLVQKALDAEQDFRNKQGFIDPVSAATSTSTLLMQAMGQRIELENEYLVDVEAMSAQAPTVIELKSRLDALDQQIAALKAQLTGSAGRTISASLVSFESLELQRGFAEKLYSIAQDALEAARIRAEEQNIFVSTFVPPDLPQESEYPQRLALSLLIPIGLMVVWGIFALMAAAIEDHRY